MEHLTLDLALIHASPTNPRKSFSEPDLLELAESIKKHGVLQPILVRPWPAAYAFEGDRAPAYELIAGERRFRASKLADQDDIPALVRDLSDREVLEIQIIENLQRKGLHEMEEAEGYQLMMQDHGYSAEDLAKAVGKSKAYIYGRLKLTALSTQARLAFRDGRLSASTALLVARIPGDTMQTKAIRELTEGWNGPMSHRAAKEHIQRNYCFYLDDASFPLENLAIHPAAGACSACPKRSGTVPEAFADIDRADVCTDPECYKAKQAGWLQVEKDRARQAGKQLIEGEEAKGIDPHYGQKYVALDKREYSLPGGPTVREALKDKPIETILIEDADSGKLIEVVEKKAMAKALEAAGAKVDDYRAGERELERKARAENKFRSRLYQGWHDAMSTSLQGDDDPTFETDELRLIAKRIWGWLGSDLSEVVNVLWAPKSEKDNHWDRRHEMNQHVVQRIADMSRKELTLFVLDCVLASDGRCGIHNVDYVPQPLIELAAPLGVKADDIRAEIAAEEAAKGKKPAKTAPEKCISTPPKAPQGGDGVGEIGLMPGDTVVVKADAVAEGGWALNSRGKAGTVVRPDEDDGWYIVQINDGQEAFHRDNLIFIAREINQAKKKPIGSHPPIQFAHPSLPDLVWTGRGRQPKWVENWLAIDGNTLDQLRVESKTTPAGLTEIRSFDIGDHVKILADKNPSLIGKEGKVHGLIKGIDGHVRVKLKSIGFLAFKVENLQKIETNSPTEQSAACEMAVRCDKTLELPGVDLPVSGINEIQPAA